MKIKKELITAIQLLLQLHLLFWSFTWNLPPDFDGNQNEKALVVGNVVNTEKKIPLMLSKNSILLETVKYVKQVKEKKMASRFKSAMIPSFNEWKELEMMKQEKSSISSQKHQNRKLSRRKLNYASSKCGAKILSSNAEARHRVSILNEKGDEYMLNPCRVRQWFIIELCDTIEITQIELANYELYSSSPKSFSVFWSDIYPTHSWQALGSFVASDRRSMETFEVTPRNLGKFIKIIIFSHYGKEHYCTLSTVRVLGYSMVYGFEEEENSATENKPLENRIQASKPEEKASLLVKNKSSALSQNSTAETLRQKNKTLTCTKPNHISQLVKSNIRKTCKVSQYSRFNIVVLQKTNFNTRTCPLFQIKNKTTNTKTHTVDNISHVKCIFPDCFNSRSSYKDLLVKVGSLRKECTSSNRPSSELTNQNTSKNIDNGFLNRSRSSSNETAHVAKITEKVSSADETDTKTLKYEEFKRNYAENNPTHKDVLCSCENKITSSIESEITEISSKSRQKAFDRESFEDSAALIQKESILVKLTSRIQSSEFNLSLINVYLQELSQSYRQQIEDMHSLFNETVKAITSASDKAVLIDNHQQKEIEYLENKMSFLSNKAAHLLAEQSHMVRRVIELHAFFLILEFIIISTIFTIFMNNFKQTRNFHNNTRVQIRKYSNKYLSLIAQ